MKSPGRPVACLFFPFFLRFSLGGGGNFYISPTKIGLTPEAMKLRGNTKSKTAKDENGENVPHLELTEVVLVHCNIVNNDYQHDSRVLHTFVSEKSFGQLLDKNL